MNKSVFLDRDGVVTKNINNEAPKKPSDLKLNTIMIPIIIEFQKRGYKVIIVSNQPDVAFGKISEQVKESLVKRFEKLLKKNNVFVDIYYCFHHPRGLVKKYMLDCSCRKPKPGLILEAAEKNNINTNSSYIIGDRATDIIAGNLAGVKTILFDPKNSEQIYLREYNIKPDFTIKKLDEVMELIK